MIAKPHVLVVHSEPFLRETLRRAIQVIGEPVDALDNHASVKDYLKKNGHQVKLIVMNLGHSKQLDSDLERPGVHTIEQIKENHPHLPIVIISGNSKAEARVVEQLDVHSISQRDLTQENGLQHLKKLIEKFALKPKHVVVFEPDGPAGRMLKDMLTSAHHVAEHFSDPKKMADRIQDQTRPIDLVICDSSTFRLTGEDVSKSGPNIISLAREFDLPVLASTTNPLKKHHQKLMEKGAAAILRKPEDINLGGLNQLIHIHAR